MVRQRKTSNRSKIGAPSTQIPIMVDPLGGQSLRQTPNSQNLNALSENNISYTYMNKSNLSQLTKNQLIELLLAKQKPVPMPRTKKVKPIPYPRKSVKQMVQNYENTIIKPPQQFADKPKVAPRLKKNNICDSINPKKYNNSSSKAIYG